MVPTADRIRRLNSRWICFALVLLCLLAWGLASAFLLLSRNSTPTTIVVEDRNASERIYSQGFAGPVTVFQDHEFRALQNLYDDWNSFLPKLKERLSSNGFVQSPEETCFLWLPECFSLAKHGRILQIVKDAIGPRVLLHRMTIWKGKNEALQRFHRNAEAGRCEKMVNFVYGASLQLVSQSHSLPERVLQFTLRNLQHVEEESFTIADKLEQLDFLERLVISRIKRMTRSPKVWLENLELGEKNGVFFHGGTLHRIGETFANGTGLLLQFISADCKVREEQRSGWGSQGTSYSLYLPPTLLVAGNPKKEGAVNDVRTSLSHEDGLLSENVNTSHSIAHLMGKERLTNDIGVMASEMGSVKVFSDANAPLKWEDKGLWRTRKIGEASTSIMVKGIIERSQLEHTSTDLGMVAGDGEQVIVVLSKGLLYTRAVKEKGFQHYELLELRSGSAVLLSKQVLQALVPLESEAEILSLHWIGHDIKTSNNSKKNNIETSVLKNDRILGTRAMEGRTITLGSGQAYDPDNNEVCDVIVFVVEGTFLQVLPLNAMLQTFDVLLIPAHEACILWNIGARQVRFFAMHLCRIKDEIDAMTSFGASGRVF